MNKIMFNMDMKQFLGTTTLVILWYLDKSNMGGLSLFINTSSVINVSERIYLWTKLYILDIQSELFFPSDFVSI